MPYICFPQCWLHAQADFLPHDDTHGLQKSKVYILLVHLLQQTKSTSFPTVPSKRTRAESHWPDLGHMHILEPITVPQIV